MSRVALFIHSGHPEAIDTGRLIAAWLNERGHTPSAGGPEVALLGSDLVATVDPGVPDRDADLVVAVGEMERYFGLPAGRS